MNNIFRLFLGCLIVLGTLIAQTASKANAQDDTRILTARLIGPDGKESVLYEVEVAGESGWFTFTSEHVVITTIWGDTQPEDVPQPDTSHYGPGCYGINLECPGGTRHIIHYIQCNYTVYVGCPISGGQVCYTCTCPDPGG